MAAFMYLAFSLPSGVKMRGGGAGGEGEGVLTCRRVMLNSDVAARGERRGGGGRQKTERRAKEGSAGESKGELRVGGQR